MLHNTCLSITTAEQCGEIPLFSCWQRVCRNDPVEKVKIFRRVRFGRVTHVHYGGLQILIVAFQSIGHVIQLTAGGCRKTKINDFGKRSWDDKLIAGGGDAAEILLERITYVITFDVIRAFAVKMIKIGSAACRQF